MDEPVGEVPSPDDDDFISWMRTEWEDRTSTGNEVEFWKFVKMITDPWVD